MALAFNATNERVDHGSGASLDDLTSATYAAWVYLDDIPSVSGHPQRIAVKSPKIFGTAGSDNLLM